MRVIVNKSNTEENQQCINSSTEPLDNSLVESSPGPAFLLFSSRASQLVLD